jgi:hypothetical protein
MRSLHCKCGLGATAIFHQAVIGGWNNMARGKISPKVKYVRFAIARNSGSASARLLMPISVRRERQNF